MLIVQTVSDLRQALAGHRHPAFVPTMGNLHEGHIALVRQAKPLGDITVASIFVNRLQFLPHEDFDSYPRTWDKDCAQLKAAGCDLLFAPREADLYPEPQTFKVHPDPALGDMLEGHFRPGFFIGVSTVVMKLFACVLGQSGGTAVFGKKDYQQLMVIRQLVQQFALPITIAAGETSRAANGLALSSRNGYLSAAEREEAGALSQALGALAQQWQRQPLHQHEQPGAFAAQEKKAQGALIARGWQPDYLTVRRRNDLLPATPADAPGTLVALGAARLGGTRLIDNLEF